MRTLHCGLRVQDLDRAVEFYRAVGYRELGRVTTPDDELIVFLRLPEDPFVALELVYNERIERYEAGTAFSHLVIQVDSLDAELGRLAGQGIALDGPHLPGGPDGPKTCFLTDPDGHRIELVEWPAGHAAGLVDEDFAE
jgi:lactoylglutathione lyase